MVQRSKHLRFPSEPCETIGIQSKRARQDLQSHLAVQPRIATAVNLSHPAHAKQSDNLIRSETMTRVEHLIRLACGSSKPERYEASRPAVTFVASVNRSMKLSSAASDAKSDSTSPTQCLVAGSRRSEKGLAFSGRPLDGGLKQRLNARPSFVSHETNVRTEFAFEPGFRRTQVALCRRGRYV